MARVEVTMPKMGESIMEGTIIEWSKQIGDTVEEDETLLEIATDKVDSEVPSPSAGTLVEILAQSGETIEVGDPIAIIDTDPSASASAGEEKQQEPQEAKPDSAPAKEEPAADQPDQAAAETPDTGKKSEPEPVEAGGGAQPPVEGETEPQRKGSDGRFFSPLVRSIAKEEGLSQEELDSIQGSGAQGRVTKQDVLDFLEQKKSGKAAQPAAAPQQAKAEDTGQRKPAAEKAAGSGEEIKAGEIDVEWPRENVEVIKMDRMRKIIAEHMVRSKRTSAHVTTFAEADVTNLVKFREKNKDRFQREHGYKLTFTPFFMEATIQALREYPLLNSSVDEENDRILLKREINYGMAVALGEGGTGGLVVPVIKNAGEMNIYGLSRAVHELAEKARKKQLSPDDLSGGTFTLTNYGSVGNLMGTPIINQPQVAIFGTGNIEKRPVVKEFEGEDVITIRHMMYLSMSYDHRIIDGALGGSFVSRVKELLENFDVNRSI